MKDWLGQLERAQDGDLDAFGAVVREFQDMAVGYAFSILRDFGLAEDAAQEAFIQVYRDLASLREPKAFPSWLRRIVFKQCDRLTRGRRVPTVPLDGAAAQSSGALASPEPDPAQTAERRELREAVLAAIRALPDHERAAVTLFYINGYSQAEVGEFLEVPVSTVKNRLHSAREKLRQGTKAMAKNSLTQSKPGKEFARRVLKKIAEVRVYLPKAATWKQGFVFLTDARKRCVTVNVEHAEGAALEAWLGGKGSPEALDPHTALVRALGRFGRKIQRAVLHDLQNCSDVARIIVAHGGRKLTLRCWPSDALSLAVRVGAPIAVEAQLIDRHALKTDDGRYCSAREGQAKLRATRWPSMKFDLTKTLRKLEKSPESKALRSELPWSVMKQIDKRMYNRDNGKIAQVEKWAKGHHGGELEGVARGLLGAIYMQSHELSMPAEKFDRKAIPELEAARRLRPEDRDIAFDLATVHMIAGRKKQALALLLEAKHPETPKCGNFIELWQDRRFRSIAGPPEETKKNHRFIAQIKHSRVGSDPLNAPKQKPPDFLRPALASARQIERIEDFLDQGPLLAVSCLARPDGSLEKPALVIEIEGRSAAAIRMTKAQRERGDSGLFSPGAVTPRTLQTIAGALKGTGIKLDGVVLTRRTRAGIEGALLLRAGGQRECIALKGLAAAYLALAAECPLLITETLAEKLYVRGKNGRPLALRTARRRLAEG
ncbi:bifunctional nuclease domain-containing protein [Candidatus Sumerlaeota bacterium]